MTIETVRHYKQWSLRRDIPALLLILFLAAASYLTVRNSSFSDFVQYPSAKMALQLKEDPYNPSELLEHQRSLLKNSAVDSAVMFWCPPWVLAFIPPIWFKDDLGHQAHQWVIIGNIIFFMSALLCYSFTIGLVPRNIGNAWILAGVGAFCPAILNIFTLGQSSSLLVFFGSIALCAALRGRYLIAGIAASGLTFKPHLFFVAAAFLLGLIWRSGKARKFLWGVTLGLIMLIAIQEVSWPGSTALWARTLLFNEFNSETVHRGNWLCANFSGFLRSMLGISSPALSVIIPVMTFLLFGYIVARDRIKLSLFDTSWIIPVSLLCAPYGWFYDQGILLPLQFMVVAHTLQNKHQYLPLTFLGFQIIICFTFLALATSQHHLWWGPIGLLFVTLAIKTSRRDRNGHYRAPHKLCNNQDKKGGD